MNRRAWIFAAALLLPAGQASATVISPPAVFPTPTSIGAAGRWVPVCGRGRPIGSGSWDPTDIAIFDVSACTVPANLGVRALRLSYMGSDISNVGEIDRGVTFTGDAAISIPSAQFSAVVNAAVASGATSIPVQVAMASPGNGISAGMGVQGTNIPSGSWITAVSPSVSSSNVMALAFTFTNAAGATATTGALTAGQILTLTGRNQQASWGTQKNVTIFPARRFFDSDPIGVALSPLAQFFVRGAWTASAAGFYLGDYPSAASGSTRLAGEGSQRAASALGDHTMDPSVPSNSGGGYFAPWTVLGQVTTPTPSILIVGDSIAAGSGDLADGYGHQGYIERALGQAVPWASIARGSTTAVQMAVNLQLVQQAAAEISATDVLLEYGRNDLNATGNPQSAATVEASLRTIATPLVASGTRVWAFTCPPTTMSQDGWTTVAGQFFSQQASTVSSAVAAGAAGAAVTIPIASSSGIQTGELVAVQSAVSTIFPAGTTVTAVPNATSVTVTPPAGGAIGAIASGLTLAFGTRTISASATPIEWQREQFNAYQRANWGAQGYAGLIDDDQVLEDPVNTGLWRTDLGAASLDGIHPAAALHGAVVSSGILAPSMFPAK